MIKLDGSHNEGGGQIIRTALALSILTLKSFEADNIRAKRPNPGLKPQHIYCVKALRELCNASVEGLEEKSLFLKFEPGKLKTKNLVFDIGTAGSITLVMQALLFPAIFGKKKIKLEISGGTDVMWSIQVDYFTNVLIPQLKRFADIDVKVLKRGYYPKGKGKIIICVKPQLENLEQAKKHPINLIEQGNLFVIKGIVHSSKSLAKNSVAERIAKSAELTLSKLKCPVRIRIEYCETLSDGCGITLWAIFSKTEETDSLNPIILGSAVLGEKNKKAEEVGRQCALKLVEEIESKAPVDQHLADNLIPFLAIAGGKIKVSKITNHTLTNIYVTEKFFPVQFKIDNNIIEVNL